MSIDRIQYVATELYVLSCSFRHTGNDKVGDALDWMARQLNESCATLQREQSEALTQRVKDAENNSATILRAVLAGREMSE